MRTKSVAAIAAVMALSAGTASAAGLTEVGAVRDGSISTDRTKLISNPTLLTFRADKGDVRGIIEMMAHKGDMNVILDESVQGQITIDLKAVPLDEALDVVLKMKALDAKRLGSTLLVASSEVFRKKGFGGVTTALLRFDNAKIEDVEKIMKDALSDEGAAAPAPAGDGKPVAGPAIAAADHPIKIIKDTRTNSLLITATEDVIDRARQLKALLDVPTPQVEIEVEMLETSENGARSLGLSYGFGGSKFGAGYNNSNPDATAGGSGNQAGNPSTVGDGIGLSYTALGNFTANFNARLNALIQDGQARVLANPKVVAQDNKEASIAIVNKHPVLKSTTNQGIISTSVEFVDVGQQMTITPRIDTAGYVTLDLKPNISVEGPSAILNGNPVPVVDSRSISTTMRVADNTSIVIGGLKRTTSQTSTSRIPILGQLPLLGWLFSNTVTNSQTVNVVLVVTPHIQVRMQSSANGVFGTGDQPPSGTSPSGPPKF